jgi:hypothetical protein
VLDEQPLVFIMSISSRADRIFSPVYWGNASKTPKPPRGHQGTEGRQAHKAVFVAVIEVPWAAFFCREVDLEMGQPRFYTLPPTCLCFCVLLASALPPTCSCFVFCTQELGNMYKPCSLQVPPRDISLVIGHI